VLMALTTMMAIVMVAKEAENCEHGGAAVRVAVVAIGMEAMALVAALVAMMVAMLVAVAVELLVPVAVLCWQRRC
jgi:hypothetical protein